MGDENQNKRSGTEIVLGVLLFFAGAWSFVYAVQVFMSGQKLSSLDNFAVALICFAGSVDPVNFLWLCLPLQFRPIKKPERFGRVAMTLGLIGGFIFIAGRIATFFITR